MKLAMIGLGKMGANMARRLIGGGHEVVGYNLETAVTFGPDPIAGPVINASRSVIFASLGTDFAAAARNAALELREAINAARSN